MAVEILFIRDGASDGDGRKWPKHHYVRNDEYFKERVATDRWVKDLPGTPKPGVIYRLDKLPQGYAGFERARPDSKHIDRYIYGHPRGQFRSLNEFYPHFKHLMDNGGPVGCPCRLCTGSAKGGNPAGSGSGATRAKPSAPSRPSLLSQKSGFQSTPSTPQKRSLVDVEGTADIYEAMMKKLKAARSSGSLDLAIDEHMSPDWWTGTTLLSSSVQKLQRLPRYAPRCGEVVLFFRKLHDGEIVRWHSATQTYRRLDTSSRAWGEQPEWQAGVIAQTPDETTSDNDLINDEDKLQSVNSSGYRIEPLSDPGDDSKPWTKQHKLVPLHAIRPFSQFRDCLHGTAESDGHPTISHAMKITSSFCVIGRYRFRGSWPNATVFAMGVYLGPELILLGDAVRLLPRNRDQKDANVTDIMVVSAIRLRFVNLDFEDDDQAPDPPALPYQTCLHLSGRVYTVDPSVSFYGSAKAPIDPSTGTLPDGIEAYGPWYHYCDPDNPNAKIELPFTRILGRCFENVASDSWFAAPENVQSTPAFQPVNSKPTGSNPAIAELSRGLKAITDARIYSRRTDPRLKVQKGHSWFWADTRIEQLDLHEVNDRFVGVRHEERSRANVFKWQSACKRLASKNEDLGRRQAAEHGRQEMEPSSDASTPNALEMPTSNIETRVENETTVDMERMQLDALDRGGESTQVDSEAMVIDGGKADGNDSMATTVEHSAEFPTNQNNQEVIELNDSDSEDEDDDELMEKLTHNIRRAGEGGAA